MRKSTTAFIAAITSAREERKAGVRDKVQAIRAEVLEKGESGAYRLRQAVRRMDARLPAESEPG